MQTVRLSEIWSQAWVRFQKTWHIGLLLVLVPALLSLLPAVGYLLTLIASAAYFTYGIKSWDAQEEKLTFEAVFPTQWTTYLKIVLLALLSSLPALLFFTMGIWQAVVVAANRENDFGGLSLGLILAGVLISMAIWALLFTSPYLIVDRGASIGEALSLGLSYSLQNLSTVVLFCLTSIGINLLGALACGIGVLITAPMTYIAGAGLYRQLSQGSPTPLA